MSAPSCPGGGPAPTSWEEAVERGLESLWGDDREAFEAWLSSLGPITPAPVALPSEEDR